MELPKIFWDPKKITYGVFYQKGGHLKKDCFIGKDPRYDTFDLAMERIDDIRYNIHKEGYPNLVVVEFTGTKGRMVWVDSINGKLSNL